MDIDISGIVPEKVLFHNEEIDTYRTSVSFEEIEYWPGNLRTVLHFSKLEKEFGKKLVDIVLSDLTNFLAKRDELKLTHLARSIGLNGVRVPLILLDDGTLLDGNRRFFACSYLYHQQELQILYSNYYKRP